MSAACSAHYVSSMQCTSYHRHAVHIMSAACSAHHVSGMQCTSCQRHAVHIMSAACSVRHVSTLRTSCAYHVVHANSSKYHIISGKCAGLLNNYNIYPEWPHRQCVGLAYPRTRVRASFAAASLAIYIPHLHRAIRGTQGVLCQGSLHSRPGCRQSGVRLIHFLLQ